MSPREKIVKDFAEWTAFSATRSGSPLKSRMDVYPLIRIPDYEIILKGEPISKEEFNVWHEQSTTKICSSAPILPIGWATKLINIYLKTRVYIGNEGRPDLIKWIHPPIDGGLWEGIYQIYHKNPEIMRRTHGVQNIKDIKTYDRYKLIIEGCSMIAQERGCLLIEIEELWQGTKI